MYKIEDVNLEPLEDAKFVKLKKMNYIQNGTQKHWEIAKVHDSVAILIFDEEKKEFILVKQFRPPIYLQNDIGFTYELCAGIIDKELSLKEIAKEEILEECGYEVEVDKIEKITSFYTSVGFAGAKQTLFFVKVNESMRLNDGGGIEHEEIEVLKLPLSKAKEFVFDETKPKTPGLMFAFYWFFEQNIN